MYAWMPLLKKVVKTNTRKSTAEMLIRSVLSRISHKSVRGNTPMEKATFENRLKPSFDCSTEECQRSPGER
jgi:hypothetical protein